MESKTPLRDRLAQQGLQKEVKPVDVLAEKPAERAARLIREREMARIEAEGKEEYEKRLREVQANDRAAEEGRAATRRLKEVVGEK